MVAVCDFAVSAAEVESSSLELTMLIFQHILAYMSLPLSVRRLLALFNLKQQRPVQSLNLSSTLPLSFEENVKV